MIDKLLRNLLPLLCAALIAAAGLLIPQWLLERQKANFLAGTGAVETSALAALNYKQLRSAATSQHISDLSAWAEELSEDDISSDPLREPLDTELDEAGAAEAVATFQQTLLEELYAWGFGVNWETVNVSGYYGTISQSAAESATGDAEWAETVTDAAEKTTWGVTSELRFCVSEENSSLSAWVLEDSADGAQLVMDALSGIPVYGYAELDVIGTDSSISQNATEAVRYAFETVYSLSFSNASLESSNSPGSSAMDNDGSLQERDNRKIALEEWEMTTEDGYTLRVTFRSAYDSGEYPLNEKHRVELRLTAE